MKALITGASSGIGRDMAKVLGNKGFDLILVGRNKERLEEVKSQINTNVEIITMDLASEENCKELYQKTKGLDVLINNAGIARINMFSDVTEEEWDEIMNVNLKSAFFTIQEVLPNMVHQKNGCIINISSIWGLVGASCEAVYSASKAGLDGLTKSLAKELGLSNIRVNGIAPGIIDTNMNSNIDEKIKKEIEKEIPLGRIGTPEDIYKCAKWLVEDNYVTGQIISPNGGWVI